jgi:hypothetical protein
MTNGALTQRERERDLRIIRAVRAYKEIIKRTDAKLEYRNPLSNALVFVRRLVQPVVVDCGFFFTLRDEKNLAQEVKKAFGNTADGYFEFRCSAGPAGADFVSVHAVEHPKRWEWRADDREVCEQIYGNLRAVDVLMDDCERIANTEIELMKNEYPDHMKDIRIISETERQERVNKIKSVTEDFWLSIYTQLSAEDEAREKRRELDEQAGRDRRHLKESWCNYSTQVKEGRERNGRVELVALERAKTVAPDQVPIIKSDIEDWDRDTANHRGEEVIP